MSDFTFYNTATLIDRNWMIANAWKHAIATNDQAKLKKCRKICNRLTRIINIQMSAI